jgi:hypothetical protein
MFRANRALLADFLTDYVSLRSPPAAPEKSRFISFPFLLPTA